MYLTNTRNKGSIKILRTERVLNYSPYNISTDGRKTLYIIHGNEA